jgi:hypothetical protein
MEKLLKLLKDYEVRKSTMARLIMYADGDGRVEIARSGFTEIAFEFESSKELIDKLSE